MPKKKTSNEIHPYSYGFKEHLIEYGNGANRLRTKRFSQPSALREGDILATGDRVLSKPQQGVNGGIKIHLTGGFDGHWIEVPSRIPLALLTKEDGAPRELWRRAKTKHTFELLNKN